MFIELAESPKNRKQKFLKEMNKIIPWEMLLDLCNNHWEESKLWRNRYNVKLLLKIYFLQQWYCLWDPTVEAEIYDSIAFRSFLNIDHLWNGIPDETTVLRFRRFLEKHDLQKQFFEKTTKILEKQWHLLKRGTIVDATLIAASPSTKNKSKKRDPEMSSTKKNNNFYFWMKQHIGVDIEKGMIHSIKATTAKVHDIKMLDECLHGEEKIISWDKAYWTKKLKKEMRSEWKKYYITDKASRNKKLSHSQKKNNNKISRVRWKVEHPFRVIKHLWRHSKTRYKWILKNEQQWNSLAMLSNFYILSTNKCFSA